MLLPQPPDAAPQSAPALQPPINILDGILATGIKHHQHGRLPEAERIYRSILAIDARHAATLHMLGTLAHQVGRLDVAAQLVGAAVGIAPEQAAYHSRLGAIFQAQAKLEQAAASYRRALELDPNLVDVQINLAVVLHSLDAVQPSPSKTGESAGSHKHAGIQAGLG